MGAWIEIANPPAQVAPPVQSHSLWVRGLKSPARNLSTATARSHSLWVRGLKSPHAVNKNSEARSHSLWVRGLKSSCFLR